MIRIVHYIGSFELGGSQAMIMNVYRNIDREKLQFDFVVHDSRETTLTQEALAMGAKIYTCPRYTLSTSRAYVKWWKQFICEHKEYKIVHSHVRSTAAIVLKIAKKQGRITIAHSHSTSSGKGIQALVKNLLQYRIRYVADYFMGCSQNAGEWLFGKKVCRSDRYFNIQNAIDAQSYAYDEEIAKRARAELGYTENDYVIGHVGRFSQPKNHAFLLEVFKALRERDEKYKLLLVGDGELRGDIERAVADKGLQDVVQMTGLRRDVQRLMMAMDLFLFPSKWEGLGMVLVEAQATGCPCLASTAVPQAAKVCELAEFMNLLCPPSEWADKIRSMNTIERRDRIADVRRCGFDVTDTSQWLQEFYLGLK